MHDGFLCKPESLDELAKFITAEYYKHTSYRVSITHKVLNSYSNKIISTNYTYPPSLHHTWGYKTPVSDNPIWNQAFADWKKNNPDDQLEIAHAKRMKTKERFMPIMKAKKRDAADWKIITEQYKKYLNKPQGN